MDSFLALVLMLGVAVAILMAIRFKRKTAELLEQSPAQRPEPKRSDRLVQPPAQQREAAKPTSRTAPRAEPTRAIRNGWQLCQVAFEYEDAEGNWTSREVTVHHVDRKLIKGECHAARAERTFRIDRVMSDITDMESGEILDIDVWCKQYQKLKAKLREKVI